MLITATMFPCNNQTAHTHTHTHIKFGIILENLLMLNAERWNTCFQVSNFKSNLIDLFTH